MPHAHRLSTLARLRILARELRLRVRIYRQSGIFYCVDRARHGARSQLGPSYSTAAPRLRAMAFLEVSS